MPAKSPGGLRSPRNRALELGINKSGFTNGVVGDEDYCGACGMALNMGHPHSHYADGAKAAQPANTKPSAGLTPFKLGK